MLWNITAIFNESCSTPAFWATAIMFYTNCRSIRLTFNWTSKHPMLLLTVISTSLVCNNCTEFSVIPLLPTCAVYVLNACCLNNICANFRYRKIKIKGLESLRAKHLSRHLSFYCNNSSTGRKALCLHAWYKPMLRALLDLKVKELKSTI